MKRSTFNYIADILREYPDTEKYIKSRMNELKYPDREEDINADIRGTKSDCDPHINWLIKVEQDRRLRVLERNHMVISTLLDECDADTKIIIKELYMKRYPKYRNIQDIVDNNILSVGKSKAYHLRDKFFKHIQADLDL